MKRSQLLVQAQPDSVQHIILQSEVIRSQYLKRNQLQHGIPEYRLPKNILQKEIQSICSLGVEIKTNTEVGKDITIDKLKKQGYKAIFIGAGVWDNLKLRIKGEDLKGVYTATGFLKQVNAKEKVKLGKKVAVIGGGNAAMDAVRTAIRMGSEAFIVYRRSREEMPAIE